MRIHLLIAIDDLPAVQGWLHELERHHAGSIEATATPVARWPLACVRQQPDVLLLGGGPDELVRLSDFTGLPRVLALCDRLTEPALLEFVRHGVAGSLPRTCPAAQLARAVAAVHAGQAWFPRGLLLDALRHRVLPPPAMRPIATIESLLTPREREVLELIGGALSNKEIARRLDISDNTVKTHLHRIYVKLQASGRTQAMLSRFI